MIIRSGRNFFSKIKKKGVSFFLSLLRQPPVATLNYLSFVFLKKNKHSVRWRPIEVNFSVTDKCNLSCNFCARHNGFIEKTHPHQLNDMSLNNFKKILKKLRETIYINLCGIGEPLMNEELIEIIKFAKKEGKIVSVYTNGILLDNYYAINLLKNKIDTISISLKGSDEKTFISNTNAGKEYFHAVVENIKNLIKIKKKLHSKTNIHINHVCSRDKVKDIREIIKLTKNFGADKLVFNNINLPNLFSVENKGKVFLQTDKALREELSRLKIHNQSKIVFPLLAKENRLNTQCTFADRAIWINAQGDASPCRCLPPQKKFGNIFSETNILNAKSFVFLRKTLAKEALRPCLSCCFLSNIRKTT